jgi:hypothetical protein
MPNPDLIDAPPEWRVWEQITGDEPREHAARVARESRAYRAGEPLSRSLPQHMPGSQRGRCYWCTLPQGE